MEIVVAILSFTAVPLVFAALARFVRWLYAKLALPRRPAPRRSGEPPGEGPELPRMRAADVRDAPSEAAARAREQTARVNRHVGRAHIGAWLVYASIVVWVYLAHTRLKFDDNVRLAIGYGFLAPQLLILFWEIGLSRLARLLGVLLYLTGMTLLLLTTTPTDAAMIAYNVGLLAILPFGGLLTSFMRWLQPFLGFVLAVVLEIFGVGALLYRYGSVPIAEKGELAGVSLWWLALGLVNVVVSLILGWVLVRQRKRAWAVAGVTGVASALLLDWNLAHQGLPLPVLIVCFLSLAVLQILLIWCIFKVFVWLQERHHLTSTIVQVHLSWTLLSAYFIASTYGEKSLYENPEAVRHGALLALAVHLVLLHLLLFRIRRRRWREQTPKRLLLLRVFGQPNERESLLDELDDTWRRIGSVDLLAASDVALRTLEGHMLEAFLLRRQDEKFLHTRAEVKAHIAQHQSALDTEVRYPMHPLYCHEKIWRSAFTRLARETSIVLMDLRGFTTNNKGCELELTHLLKYEQRLPIVLLVDSASDLPALEQIVRKTGAKRDFATLHFGKRSPDERRALFELLLNGAFSPSG